jgi:hypothetical protein
MCALGDIARLGLRLPSTAEFTQFSLRLATQLIGDDIAINAMLRERFTGGAARRWPIPAEVGHQ